MMLIQDNITQYYPPDPLESRTTRKNINIEDLLENERYLWDAMI